MTFNSMSEVISFIEQSVSQSMPEMAEEIKKIMDETTKEQVKGWSGDIFNSVIPNSSYNSAEASFENTGGWISLISGNPVDNPIVFLENGTTWNRGASNIMEESLQRCEVEVSEKLIGTLRQMGIPIE